MSVISGTVAAIEQKDAAKDANRKNLKAARETNEANLVLDMARRGLALPDRVGSINVPEGAVGKSSSILPYYLSDSEREASDYASSIFNTLKRYPDANSEAAYREIADKYIPAMDQASEDAIGVFDGSVTDEEIAAAQPVAAARIKLAGARKDAGLEALQEKLNEIKAIQSRKGYTGDSLASSRLRFDATRKILGDAAIDQGNAELANAMDSSNIRRNAIARRLANPNLGIDQARRDIQLQDLPGEGMRDRAEKNISIFNPFRVTGGFQPIQRPERVQPVPSNLGIAATAAAELGQAAASYYLGGMGGGGALAAGAIRSGGGAYGNNYKGGNGNSGTGGGFDYMDFSSNP